MKNRYEINDSNEIIRNDSGTCTAEKFFETDENLYELYMYDIPIYYIQKNRLVERNEEDILSILEKNNDVKESYRKKYCSREIRKLYDINKEFKLQRKGILNPEDLEFKEYSNNIETIINNSKNLTVIKLMEE